MAPLVFALLSITLSPSLMIPPVAAPPHASDHPSVSLVSDGERDRLCGRRRAQRGKAHGTEWRVADGGRNGALDRLLSSRHDTEGRAADDGAAELAEGRAADDGHDGVRGVARHSSWHGVAKLAPRSAAQHMAGAMTKKRGRRYGGHGLGLPTTCSKKCLCGNSK
jgi:hypothetical protein